ncbi:MAG: hypothetical protein HFJ12_00125 [Bacilli bacterium]|nr:hypothetical protein [Bacilli bacterium]
MKRHNTIKVVLITVLVFMLLSWILPAAYFQSSYVEQGRVQMGLFDLFTYPTTALSYFGYIALFILVVGGFYGILNKIPAYRILLDKIAKSFKKRGKIVLSIMMVLLAVITSICGLQLGLIIFFPFLIAVILLMGYDKLVAALTVVGSTMLGIAGTTFAYANTSVVLSTLSVKITSNMLVKIIILVVGLGLLIFNTIRYINKMEKASKERKKTTKKTESKEESTFAAKLDDFVPAATKSKAKVWPIAVAFSVIFVIMIMAFISWSGAFNITAFDQATTSVTGFKIFGFNLFGKLLGNVNAFGSWTLAELMATMIIFVGLLMIIYKVKFNEGLQAFITGAKRALEPAVLVILIYTCLVIATYHPFQLVIYKSLFSITKGFNVFTSSIAAIFAGLFNVDPLYTFQSVLPYLASIVSDKATYKIIAVVYQAMYGVTMLIAPTSVILMGILSYLGISYKDWFKNVWKLVLELVIIMLIIFTILVLI